MVPHDFFWGRRIFLQNRERNKGASFFFLPTPTVGVACPGSVSWLGLKGIQDGEDVGEVSHETNPGKVTSGWPGFENQTSPPKKADMGTGVFHIFVFVHTCKLASAS